MFQKDLVFTSNGDTSTEVFTEIAEQLLAKDLVKPEYLENLIKREASFPTGMDMKVVNPELPNIAIPHTEVEFVKTSAIIPVKLTNPIRFNNMISPDDELEVGYLFMILNNDPNSQAGMLANIMDFMVTTDSNDLKNFFATSDTQEITDFLNSHFKK